jgi:MYND finger
LAQKQQQQPLRLSSSAAAGDGEWVHLVLASHAVAVVQSLPVPFHISFAALRLVPSGIVTLSSIPLSPRLFPKHYHRHAYWPNVARQLQELERQRNDPWQSQFEQQRQRQHPEEPAMQQPHAHSSPSPALQLSSSQPPIVRKHHQQQDQQRGVMPLIRDDDKKRTCACCFQENPKVRCGAGGRCENVFYCDRVCQQGHWTVHKKTCRSQQQQQQRLLGKFKTDAAATTTTTSTSSSSSRITAASNKNHQQSKRTWW